MEKDTLYGELDFEAENGFFYSYITYYLDRCITMRHKIAVGADPSDMSAKNDSKSMQSFTPIESAILKLIHKEYMEGKLDDVMYSDGIAPFIPVTYQDIKTVIKSRKI